MPVIVQWLSDAENIVLVEYSAPWTWEDMQAAIRTYNEMGAGRDIVYGLHDFSRAPDPPAGSLLHSLQDGVTLMNPNVKMMVGVGVPRLSRVFAEVVLKVFRIEVAWALSRDEAVEIIRKRRAGPPLV